MAICRALLPLLIPAVVLLGCGSASNEPPPSPPPVKDTVFGDMVSAQDKARAVEATTMKQKEHMDRAIREAE